MPSFATTAVVRDSGDGLHIALNARFVFVTGAPSDTIYALKGRVPDNVDVIVQSDLVITLAGSLNRVRVSSRAMQGSAIAQHLLNYFSVVRTAPTPPPLCTPFQRFTPHLPRVDMSPVERRTARLEDSIQGIC